jgi:ergothioneine biosynthesis protein EgtB
MTVASREAHRSTTPLSDRGARRRVLPSPAVTSRSLAERFSTVRAQTESLCASLEPEDHVVQPMPDASPVGWHLAHTTWFFETFVLAHFAEAHRPFDPHWGFLFNSYYEAIGPRHPRPRRGLITRPTVREIYAYRAAVDERVLALLATLDSLAPDTQTALRDRLMLGLHHEQQHQELILTDILHAFSCNPLEPAYSREPLPPTAATPPLEWFEHEGGLVHVGYDLTRDGDFAFDNELPVHKVYLEPFAIASRLATCGEYLAFIEDRGYERPELWLSDGWASVRAEGWDAPLYWSRDAKGWSRFTLYGRVAIEPDAPVMHLSGYEADAFARWSGARLPTEPEWEVVARRHASPATTDGTSGGSLVAQHAPTKTLFGGAWTWTASPYVAYPGFHPAEGAVGEYNGKFMANQVVLRGGSCFTPHGHVRASYRNFFPLHARWQATGVRLAR